jgi:hypothetical protein
MKLYIEIMFEGECIESRQYDEGEAPLHLPLPGDLVHMQFQNPSISECHGKLWRVEERIFLLFETSNNYQTVQLYCVPTKIEERYDL